MKIISLGWGVQSFTLAAMSALDELEKVDFAIHADTTYESEMTYAFAEKYTPWLEERGVKVVTVKNKIDNYEQTLENQKGIFIPAFTLDKNGKKGSMLRTCTGRWKIQPMRQYIKTVRQDHIEQWMGISLDEWQRMKDSDVSYITNRYPLIEKKMTRNDCIEWLNKNNIDIPVKSSCVFCPYHSSKEWREVQNRGNDWENAIKIDNKLRTARPGYRLYLHPSARPLEDIDFRSEQEKGQMNLWDAECSGICGV